MRKSAHIAGAVLLAAAALVAVRGAESTPPASISDADLAAVTLPGESLYDGDALSMPVRLAVAGDHLVIVDITGTQIVHLVDRRTGALRASTGSRGEGPGEFMGPRSIDVEPDAAGFWIHDVGTQRSTRYDVGGLVEGRADLRPASHSFTGKAGVLEPIRVTPDRILAAGTFEAGRLGHFDASGRFERASGALPPTEESLTPFETQFVHHGPFVATPARDRLAHGSLHSTRIELYDRRGILRAVASAPLAMEPTIVRDEESGRALVSPRSPFGYVDLAVSDAAVFALYSGRAPTEFGEDAVYGQRVHVFTWSGDFVGALDLGYDAVGIAVSTDGRELYAARHFPRAEILRHRLPGSLDPGGDEN